MWQGTGLGQTNRELMEKPPLDSNIPPVTTRNSSLSVKTETKSKEKQSLSNPEHPDPKKTPSESESLLKRKNICITPHASDKNLDKSLSTSSSIIKPHYSVVVTELLNFDPSTPKDSHLGANHSSQLLSSKETDKDRSFLGMELHAIHPVLKSFLVGSISGTCSTVLFQPLDLLKTRLQTSTVHAASHTNGMLTVMGHIVRTEKLTGLWKGMTPSLTRCVPGVGLYFAAIHGLKTVANIEGEPSPLESVLLGVTGRTLSGVIMIPFTVVKTRFESTAYDYSSVREALRRIYQREGVKGLTCGLLPTLLRDAPFSGLYLLMYTSTKKGVSQDWLQSPTFGPYVRFSCGVVAGIGASFITQPADVIKTKMQLYPNKFHTVPEVVVYVFQKYGAKGYFKGLLPRMIRRSLIAAMSWTVYEQMMKSVGLK